MAFTDPTPNPTNAQIRLGFQSCDGLPALAADRVYHVPFQTGDPGAEAAGVEVTNLSGNLQQPVALPGKRSVTGTIVSQMDVDSMLPLLGAALRNYSTVTQPGTGAYRTLLGPSQANAAPRAATAEMNLDDGVPKEIVDLTASQVAITWANGAAQVGTFTVIGTHESIWKKAAEFTPNPHTGHAWMRGIPLLWRDRTEPRGDVYLRLVDSSDLTALKFLARVGKPGPITGAAWSRTAANTITADGADGAATTEVFAGDLLDIDDALYEVSSVTDDDTIVLTTDPTGASAVVVLQEFGGYEFTVTVGNDANIDRPLWAKLQDSEDGAYMGERETSGTTLEAHFNVATGISSVASASLTGTITTNGTATVTGSGTAFLTEAPIGSSITTAGGETVRVVDVASDTSLTVREATAGSEAGVAGTVIAPPFVSLTGTISVTTADNTLTGSGTLFTTELAVGSLIRTAAGHQYRVASIADNTTATIHQNAKAIESGVAGETDYVWVFERERATWTSTFSSSNLFPEVLSSSSIRISSGSDAELAIVSTATLTFNGARVALEGIGSPYPKTILERGFLGGTLALTAEKVNVDLFRKVIEAQEPVRITIDASTGKEIASSGYEYGQKWVIWGKPAGKSAGITAADSFPETINLTLHTPASMGETDTDYPDAVNCEITSDRATPFSTTAL